jgi:hypothetical protein
MAGGDDSRAGPARGPRMDAASEAGSTDSDPNPRVHRAGKLSNFLPETKPNNVSALQKGRGLSVREAKCRCLMPVERSAGAVRLRRTRSGFVRRLRVVSSRNPSRRLVTEGRGSQRWRECPTKVRRAREGQSSNRWPKRESGIGHELRRVEPRGIEAAVDRCARRGSTCSRLARRSGCRRGARAPAHAQPVGRSTRRGGAREVAAVRTFEEDGRLPERERFVPRQSFDRAAGERCVMVEEVAASEHGGQSRDRRELVHRIWGDPPRLPTSR